MSWYAIVAAAAGLMTVGGCLIMSLRTNRRLAERSLRQRRDIDDALARVSQLESGRVGSDSPDLESIRAQMEALRSQVAALSMKDQGATTAISIGPTEGTADVTLAQPQPDADLVAHVGAASDLMDRTVSAPVDLHAAKRIFRQWCREEQFPSAEAAERKNLRVSSFEGGAVDGTPVSFEDARQVTEFIRVGQRGNEQAWLIPNPDAQLTHFSEKLFPGLAPGWERDSATYGRVSPRPLLRQSDGTWMLK